MVALALALAGLLLLWEWWRGGRVGEDTLLLPVLALLLLEAMRCSWAGEVHRKPPSLVPPGRAGSLLLPLLLLLLLLPAAEAVVRARMEADLLMRPWLPLVLLLLLLPSLTLLLLLLLLLPLLSGCGG